VSCARGSGLRGAIHTNYNISGGQSTIRQADSTHPLQNLGQLHPQYTPLEWVSILFFLFFPQSVCYVDLTPTDKEYQSPTTDKRAQFVLPLLPELKYIVKLSELVNSKWDHSVFPLSNSTVSAMCETYSKACGRDPPEDIGPTTDQIAAIKNAIRLQIHLGGRLLLVRTTWSTRHP
jgi:hypothetical protein